MRVAALIRGGKLCEKCTTRKCEDRDCATIECVGCGGLGCELCGETGETGIPGCPQQFAAPISRYLILFDLFEKGLAPEAGGVFEQSAWFVHASQYFSQEEIRVKRSGKA